MRKMSILTTGAAGALALTMMATGPAAAQSYYRDRDDDRTEDALLGAAIGAVAGALIGQGDGRYIAGGALAGAAVGATSGNDDNCGYYRDGRCYRNLGHWEREHGINSNAYGSYDYRYDDRYDDRRYRYDRNDRYRDRRDYRYDRRW